MSLDTSKIISKVMYNNVEIPLYTKPEQEKTVTPTATGVVVTPDTDYTLSKVTVNGDSNLTAGNIKSGIKIFGVTGTLESSKIQPSKSLTITSNGATTVTPDTSYDALGKVDITVNVASSTTSSNIITFEYTPTGQDLAISHDILVGAGIDTEDKFFKIIGISIFPKNGDVDWFYVSYGGTLDKTKFMQNLTYNHKIGSILTFYNLSGQLPYTIALQASTHVDEKAINKTLIVTLVLSD